MANRTIFTILGLFLTAAGFMLKKTDVNPEGIMLTLPYILIGFGCGIFGQNLGSLLSHAATKKHPDIVKNIEIEEKDERNVLINNKARAKAYDTMIFVYGAIILSFALMQIELQYTLLLVLSYLFVVFTAVYYRVKYTKEM
jgi:hypothetical protein